MEKFTKNPLDRPVLILNRLWQPLHATSARRALTLLCVGHAKVVQTSGQNKYLTHDLESWIEYSERLDNEPAVHTVSLSLAVPDIMVLDMYDQLPKREVKFSRQTVFQRDSHTCQYCDKTLPEKDLNLDHVTPRDKGGKTTWENIVTSCIRCNTRKANKMPKEANMFPRNTPRKPKWRPLFGIDDSEKIEDAWVEFIGPAK